MALNYYPSWIFFINLQCHCPLLQMDITVYIKKWKDLPEMQMSEILVSQF